MEENALLPRIMHSISLFGLSNFNKDALFWVVSLLDAISSQIIYDAEQTDDRAGLELLLHFRFGIIQLRNIENNDEKCDKSWSPVCTMPASFVMWVKAFQFFGGKMTITSNHTGSSFGYKPCHAKHEHLSETCLWLGRFGRRTSSYGEMSSMQ